MSHWPKPHLILTTFLSITCPAMASSEGHVPCFIRQVTLETPEAGYTITLKLDDHEKLAQVTAVYKGTEFIVPPEELPELKEVNLRNVFLKSLYNVAGGPQETVILVIPYEHEFRKDPEGLAKGVRTTATEGEVRVSNVLRIQFHQGKFSRWERVASLGPDNKAWRLSSKDAGEKEADNGRHESLGNPDWSWDPPRYWTRD